MGKECGAWVSRRLWGGGNTSPLRTTAWEARVTSEVGREQKEKTNNVTNNNFYFLSSVYNTI